MTTTTTRLTGVVGVLLVGALAAGLRFAHLAERPVHADEATQALILDRTLGPAGYRFNPTHFHGPTITFLTRGTARAAGETGFATFQKATLRTVTAVAGVLTVVVIFGFGRWLGGVGVGSAAVLAAVSPLLVYYSRMWIHETVLGLLALGALAVLSRINGGPRFGVAANDQPTPRSRRSATLRRVQDWWWCVLLGALLGLLYATKATAVISFIAWSGAALFTWGWPRKTTVVRLLGAAAVGLAVAAWLYTDGGRYPGALVDAVRSFGVYQNDPGHDKPAGYYFQLLLWPKYRGGFWWTEAGVAVLALVGAGRAWTTGPAGRWGRFLTWATFAHGSAYLLIAYKTPWLMVVPWLHVILLAGYGAAWPFAAATAWRWRVAMLGVVGLVAGHLAGQTSRACFRYAADDRNPYAYSPTSPDAEELSTLLSKIAEAAPAVRAGPVAVVGREYWPLPWYLRQFPRVGYWPKMADAVATLPVVLALPAEADAVAAQLRGDYFTMWRGLRHETPVTVFIRQDCWQQYLDRQSP